MHSERTERKREKKTDRGGKRESESERYRLKEKETMYDYRRKEEDAKLFISEYFPQ